MALDLLILLLLILGAVIIGIIARIGEAIKSHGILTLAWRYLSGHTWHGGHLTDAGWFTPASGKPARTNTGRAPRFYYLPRIRRAARRTGRVAVAVFLVLAWISWPSWLALAITVLALGGAAAWAGWRGWARWAERKHHNTWVKPLHLVAAHQVGLPPAADPRSWLSVEPDRSRVLAELPQGFNPGKDDKDRLVQTFVSKLGIESPEVRWMLAGPKPRLELLASVPPPPKVLLADVRARLDTIKPDELIWGIGKRSALVATSLSGDSPHIGLSMGSGAGKSVTARSLAAQMLYRGAVVLILDIKMISHQWARGLPNVAIARRPEEIHAALIWLAVELERRNEEALRHADFEGNVHAALGPRILVICEEMNATVSRLRKYWRQIRAGDDPARSPALDALDAVSFMGRQVLCNIIYIGQRLSVRASGGDGDARENIGVIAFGRYSPSNWKMLAPDFPMPPKSMTPGRLQVVTDKVAEVQCTYMPALEARELALAGVVSGCPPEMPCAPRVITGHAEPVSGPDHGAVPGTPPLAIPAGPVLVTLKEAVDEGIVTRSLAALRIARHRGQLPGPAGQRGMAYEYDAEALRAWDLAGR
jgi:hypothetical protein